MHLSAGDYAVRIFGKVDVARAMTIQADVAISLGEKQLVKASRIVMGPCHGCLIDYRIALPEDAHDLGVRIFPDADTDLCVHAIQLKKL